MLSTSLETRPRSTCSPLARRLSISRPRCGRRVSSREAISCRRRAASVTARSLLSAATNCVSRCSAELACCCWRSLRDAFSARWRVALTECTSSSLGRCIALALCGQRARQPDAPGKPGHGGEGGHGGGDVVPGILRVPPTSANFCRVATKAISTEAIGGGVSTGGSGGEAAASPSPASRAPSCRACPRSKSRRASAHSRCTIACNSPPARARAPGAFSASLEAASKPGEPFDAESSVWVASASAGSCAVQIGVVAASSCSAPCPPRSCMAACRRSLTSRSSRLISALVSREGVHNLGVMACAGWREAHCLQALSECCRALHVCQAQAASSRVDWCAA